MHFCCFFETIDQQPQPVGAHVTALPASMHDSALKKTVNTVSAPLLPAGTAPPRASFRISRRRARDGTSRGPRARLKKRGLGANREALVYASPRHGPPRASLRARARRWMSSTWGEKKNNTSSAAGGAARSVLDRAGH